MKLCVASIVHSIQAEAVITAVVDATISKENSFSLFWQGRYRKGKGNRLWEFDSAISKENSFSLFWQDWYRKGKGNRL